jgi:hypothetical protein
MLRVHAAHPRRRKVMERERASAAFRRGDRFGKDHPRTARRAALPVNFSGQEFI